MNSNIKNTFFKIKEDLVNNVEIKLEARGSDAFKQNNSKIESLIGKHTSEGFLKTRLKDEFLGCGPIKKLLVDEQVTEIIINGPNSIWFEKNGEIHAFDDRFLSPLTYYNFIQRLSQSAGVEVDLNTPCANGSWGHFRVHLVHPPLVSEFIHITLRRHPDNPWTLDKLHESGWATERGIVIIRDLIRFKKNILIVGPTGSGKTSILNACLQELPKNERVICIEDTSEIKVPNTVSTKLLTRPDSQGGLTTYTQSDLVIEALRMRPERIVMGEIRGQEAKDYALALATGHSGCLSTIHASDPQQALWRLELLIQMGAANWSIDTIRSLINLSLEYIIVTEKISTQRKLTGVYKLAGQESFGFLIDPVFKP